MFPLCHTIGYQAADVLPELTVAVAALPSMLIPVNVCEELVLFKAIAVVPT